jgi:DNA polymerase/3'-5' exonuclease PolX
MSEHPKRPRLEMHAAAERLIAELGPYCERIEIAGSIRRRAAQCADIELLCIPRCEPERDASDLFRAVVVNRLDGYCRTQLDAGRFTHRRNVLGAPAFGKRYKRLAVDGVPLDLFSVLAPASFPLLWLIRTGPTDFGRRLVTTRAKGGWLPDECHVRDGAVWRAGARLELADEAAVFALMGLQYLAPELRQ